MKRFIPLMLLSLLLAACNPSQTAKDDLQKFTERIETKSDNWSDADWDDALMHYAELCQTVERYDYSDEELREIGKLKGRCIAQFSKHSFNGATQDLEDAIIELGGALEGLFEGLGR